MPGAFTAHEEGRHAREIGLPREREQIEHHLGMLFERRRDTARLLNERELPVVLLFRQFDAPLDVAYGLEILVKLYSIARAKLPFETGSFLSHRVEDAALGLEA